MTNAIEYKAFEIVAGPFLTGNVDFATKWPFVILQAGLADVHEAYGTEDADWPVSAVVEGFGYLSGDGSELVEWHGPFATEWEAQSDMDENFRIDDDEEDGRDNFDITDVEARYGEAAARRMLPHHYR